MIELSPAQVAKLREWAADSDDHEIFTPEQIDLCESLVALGLGYYREEKSGDPEYDWVFFGINASGRTALRVIDELAERRRAS